MVWTIRYSVQVHGLFCVGKGWFTYSILGLTQPATGRGIHGGVRARLRRAVAHEQKVGKPAAAAALLGYEIEI
jgi:hypothetical protein